MGEHAVTEELRQCLEAARTGSVAAPGAGRAGAAGSIGRWESGVRHAVDLGQSVEDVAAVARLATREVRAILGNG